jgi:tripartite-type tricarboxylate transporter receptor subunit TctC
MESGYPQFEAYEWNALFAPAGTPTAITERLAREVNKIIQLPEVKERFAGLSAEPIGSTPAVLEQFRRKELTQWGDVIKRANIKLE